MSKQGKNPDLVKAEMYPHLYQEIEDIKKELANIQACPGQLEDWQGIFSHKIGRRILLELINDQERIGVLIGASKYSVDIEEEGGIVKVYHKHAILSHQFLT